MSDDSGWTVARLQLWEPLDELWVDGVDDIPAPLASPHIHQRRPGGVAVLHRSLPGDHVVQVVVGQEHMPEPSVVVRLAAPHPQYLPGGEARRYAVPREPDDFLYAAQRLRQFAALPRRAGVVPQLRRPDHGAAPVEGDEPVLLAAHPDAPHLTRVYACVLHGAPYGTLHGVGPGLGALLHVAAGKPLYEAVAH